MSDSDGKEHVGPKRRKNVIRGVVFGLVCLFVLVMLAAPLLDSVGQRWVECQVVNSNAEQGDQNATSAWVVVLDTDDCGRLIYSTGVNRDNADQKAADLEPGTYEFRLGLASQLAQKLEELRKQLDRISPDIFTAGGCA